MITETIYRVVSTRLDGGYIDHVWYINGIPLSNVPKEVFSKLGREDFKMLRRGDQDNLALMKYVHTMRKVDRTIPVESEIGVLEE